MRYYLPNLTMTRTFTMISSELIPGQIWLTYLHYIDKPAVGKVRPVLILHIDDNHTSVVALKITSKPARPGSGDIAIANWASCGLVVPSSIRTDFVFRVKIADLLREKPLGSVPAHVLEQALRQI